MPLLQRPPIEPAVLIVVAIACFVAAWFSYSAQPVTDSNPHSSSIHGWGHLFLFILIGVIVRLYFVAAGRSSRQNGTKSDTSRKT
jgi:H+/Cl- antiporter ClcA